MRLNAARIAVLIVGLTTVATLVVSAALLHVPSPETPASDPMVRSLAQRFFDAASASNEHDIAEALAWVLASDFAHVTSDPNVRHDKAEFASHLAGLHSAFPDIRFNPLETTVDANLALVRYDITGASGSLAGFPVTPLPLPGEQTAMLRVEDDRIVEAWGISAIGILETLATAQLENPSSGALIRMARATYAPGATEPLGVVPGTLVIVVEQGLLIARVDGEATFLPGGSRAGIPVDSTSPTADIELRPGNVLIIPAYTWHALRNTGTGAAMILVLGILSSSAASWSETGVPARLGSTTTSWPVSRSEGVTVVPLIGGTVDGAPTGSVRIALDRVTLEPGRGLEWKSRAGVMLLLVERGMASVDLDEGTARLIADAWQVTGRLRFGPGNGAALALGGLDQSAPLPIESTGNAIRNDGDRLLTFVVFTVLSENAS